MSAPEYLAEGKDFIDKAITQFLPGEEAYPKSIHESMRYSVLAGGKRLRPILVIAAAEALGKSRCSVLPFAVAVEFIHTYTLIHDDLPALDDDNFRRGKPTNHKIFGEAIAILAGDALLTQAFIVMSDIGSSSGIPEKEILRASHEVASAIGSTGVIGGQVVDLESEKKAVDAKVLDYIHVYKTGFLIRACIRCGAILSQADSSQLDALTRYGENIGLAFQIVDDILDIIGDKKMLGKDVGSDLGKDKATYPALFGLEESKRKAELLIETAIENLVTFDDRAQPLRNIARFFVERTF